MKQTIKAICAMLAGAAILLAAEAAWIADAGFIVRKADAQERRRIDAVYSLVAVSPADEFAGLGAGEWAK